MEKYKFHKYTSSEYTVDPAFKLEEFNMFGNAGLLDSPILFMAGKYRYVLSNPCEMKENKDLIYKIASYLFHHSTSINNQPVTYFLVI